MRRYKQTITTHWDTETMTSTLGRECWEAGELPLLHKRRTSSILGFSGEWDTIVQAPAHIFHSNVASVPLTLVQGSK